MRHFALAIAACTSLAAFPSFAQDTPAAVPIPIDAATIDFTGFWAFTSANHTVSGNCPNVAPMDGTLSLAQQDGAVSLQLLSGANCDPVSMCSYAGEIMDGNIVVSNNDIVDDENGEVTNAMNLFFYSANKADGNVSSRYLHPKGFECNWEYNLELTRPKGVQD